MAFPPTNNDTPSVSRDDFYFTFKYLCKTARTDDESSLKGRDLTFARKKAHNQTLIHTYTHNRQTTSHHFLSSPSFTIVGQSVRFPYDFFAPPVSLCMRAPAELRLFLPFCIFSTVFSSIKLNMSTGSRRKVRISRVRFDF